jgi:hypothetical protein
LPVSETKNDAQPNTGIDSTGAVEDASLPANSANQNAIGSSSSDVAFDFTNVLTVSKIKSNQKEEEDSDDDEEEE